MIFELPQSMIAQAVALPDAEIPTVARKWLEAEELQGAKQATIEKWLRDFRALAKNALESRKQVYQWMCL